MPVTPINSLSLPPSKMKTLLAASSTFAAWVVPPHAAAADAIKLFVASPSLARPNAVIGYAVGGFSMTRQTLGISKAGQPESGRLVVLFSGADLSAVTIGSDDMLDAIFNFTNVVGKVAEELISLGVGVNNGVATAGSGYLAVQRASLVRGPELTHPDQNPSTTSHLQAVMAFDFMDFLS